MAAGQDPPNRQTEITLPFTQSEWWLLSWETNEILCLFTTETAGLPSTADVQANCGTDLASQWENTPSCDYSEDISQCDGVYLHLVSTHDLQRQVTVNLPVPKVWVNLQNCSPTPPANLCTTLPALLLTGEEPLPNEHITAIRGTFGGAPFECLGAECSLPLSVTPLSGVAVEFWAESSFGDESEHFTASVRVLDSGVSAAPGQSGWYVDVISSQWTGTPIASCARIWQSFPPVGEPPAWLSTPDESALLASAEPYFYLAGRLINQGLVDARACSTGGMLPNGYADACGLEQARPLVEHWQNLFDARITEVARSSGVPSQLMKNLFAQESQFWPGVFRVNYEYGLGQLTDAGADSILIWNRDFFDQFCPLVLFADSCAGGYLKLSEDNRAILRGALAVQAKADCPTCLTGIDLTQTTFSVDLFAQTLKANCAQVNQTIYTASQQTSGALASYEDLWRMTLANYHAGPGCTAFAIHAAFQSTGRLAWGDVAANFTEPCQGVIPYVEKISSP